MGIIRLFLACVVATDHWRALYLIPRSIYTDNTIELGFNAGYAVMFFFTISGFLITYTLARNYDRTAQGALQFYRNRFVRIFSVYWPLVILVGIMNPYLVTSISSDYVFDTLSRLFLFGQDWRIAFADYPNAHFAATLPGLSQSWTLGIELTFYVLAPFLMRSWTMAGLILVLSLLLRAYFVWTLGPQLHLVWTYVFFPSVACFFLLGHIACRAAQHWPQIKNRWVCVILLPLSILVMHFGDYSTFDSWRFWFCILCFVIALPSLFESTRNNRVMNYLGNLSYPLYLIHLLVFTTLGEYIGKATFGVFGGQSVTAGLASLVAFLAISTLAAVLVHHAIENPVSALMQRVFGWMAGDGAPVRNREAKRPLSS